MLNEKEITQIILSWQRVRLDDFKIEGKFTVGRVINTRKMFAGLELSDAQDLLMTLGLRLDKDYKIVDLVKESAELKHKDSYKPPPEINIADCTLPPKDFSKQIRGMMGGLIDKMGNN